MVERLDVWKRKRVTCWSLVFVGVHIKYREIAPMILSGVLGLLMAFIVYGRLVLQPIF